MNKGLVADDDRITRRMLEVILGEWDYEPVVVRDGLAAWEVLQQADGPRIALLDWLMPGMDGVEVCRRVRRPADPAAALPDPPHRPRQPPGRRQRPGRRGRRLRRQAIRPGGAAPPPPDGAAPSCRPPARPGRATPQERGGAWRRSNSCKDCCPFAAIARRIRDDQNYWRQVEDYIAAHSEVRFSHGICPGCWEAAVLPQLEKACGGPRPCAGRVG